MKLTKIQKEAINHFRKLESPLQVIHIKHDPVAVVVASWANMTIQIMPGSGKSPANNVEKWRWLWEYIRFDIVELAFITGLGDRCVPALARARGNRLIYPDGTINQIVHKHLIKMTLLKGKTDNRKRKNDILNEV